MIGLDVGGTTMKAAVMDETGAIYARGARETGALGKPAIIFERIVSLIEELRQAVPFSIEAVGIGIPGPFDPQRGISVQSPNLNWKHVDVRTPLLAAIDLPLYFDNDLRTATLGEATFGAGRGVSDLIFAPLGTGFGAGIYSHGKLLLGANGFSGEIGHVNVPGNPAHCNCGNIGCVETIASATGIARLAREALESKLKQEGDACVNRPLYQLADGKPENITALLVAEAVRQGDAIASMAWGTACEVIGWSLALMINLFGPTKVILGGGVCRAGELLLAPVRKSAERHTMDALRKQVDIAIASLGSDSGILGAGALALRSHLPNREEGVMRNGLAKH
ncbi:MAG: ROK family protein [Clostridia bacterium]